MKPALHRSITFWSGILVMAFLCWAWRDSYRYFTVASEGDWEAVNSRGSLGIGFYQNPSPMRFFSRTEFLPTRQPAPGQCPPSVPLFLRATPQASGASGLLPKPTDFRDVVQGLLDQHSPRSWVLSLPYWCLLLGFFVLWAALLVWRARRRKRAGAHLQAG